MTTATAIATAVWNGEIDGWNTRMVADHWGITTPEALRILKRITQGKDDSFPFEYDPEFEGVSINDGRMFVWGENAEHAEGRGTPHHVWFYT